MNCNNCGAEIFKSPSQWVHKNGPGGSIVIFCSNVNNAIKHKDYESFWMESKTAEPSKENNIIEILREIDNL